jgi:hypothetical protein
MSVLLLIFALGAVILLYWVLSRLLMRSGWLSYRNAILAICFVGVLLTLFPPLYSWYRSAQQLNKMFVALGVQGTRTDVEIYLLDSVGDVMEHTKGVVGTYQLSMPVEEAEKEMILILGVLPGWDVVIHPDNPDLVMYAGCDKRAGGPEVAMNLQTDGTLTLWIPRFAPDYCYLK